MKKEIEELSLRIGIEIGNSLARRLPTLSIDMLQSNNVIPVSEEEKEEFTKLDKDWSDNYTGIVEEKDPRWDSLMKYHNELAEKYLPKEHKYLTGRLPDSINLEKVKEGIGISMWDCDYSWYSTKNENIHIENFKLSDKSRYHEITVKLSLD